MGTGKGAGRRLGVLVIAGLLAVGLARAPQAQARAAGDVVLRSGPLTATVQLDPFQLTVVQDGAVVLSTMPAGTIPVGDHGPLSFAVGARVGVQPPLAGYGIFAEAPLTWFHATTASRRPDGSVLVKTTDPTRTFTLRLARVADGIIQVEARLSNTAGVLLTGATFDKAPDERFVGFGERSDRVDETGHVVEQWNEEGPFSAGMFRPLTEPVLGKDWQGPPPFGPSSNFTMPWMLSSRGYGFLLDSTWLNRFDLTGSNSWRVETAEPTLRYRVYAGPEPADVLHRATADAKIGHQPPPSSWFFGPWYQPTGSDAFRTFLAKAWRTPISQGGYDVPITVAQTYTHYLPCAGQAGTAPADRKKSTDAYHALGYKVTTYVNSFVCQAYPGGAYQKADAHGWFVKTAAGTTYPMPYLAYLQSSSALVDFSAPGAADFWRSLIRPALADGYDGWMEDFGEYVPPDSVLADGRSGLAAHNDYCTEYHRASHQLTWPIKGSDFAQFVRCGYTGTGPVARIVWGGDPTEDDSEADGLAAAVNEGLNMGLSGIGYWGSDIGGYHALFTAGETDPELLTRWIEVGTFSPIMRTEAEGYPRPVLPGNERAQVWSPQVLPYWRALARLRTQLYPYLWAASEEYQRTGMPIMRDLVLAYPDSDVAWGRGDPTDVAAAQHEYLFGPDLLVAPVVQVGHTARSVWLPPGQWVPFWDAVHYDPATGAYTTTGHAPVLTGGRTIHVDAPLGRTPLFVKAGTCLPLLPPDVDTLAELPAGAHTRGVVTLSQGLDRLRQVPFAAPCS